MDTPRQPLSLIDRGNTRKFVAILFLGSLVLGVLVLFPDISAFYHQHTALEDFLATLATGSGLCMALLELRHSGEANEHRAELVRLTDKANDLYKDANRYREETLALQTRIHVLQEEIERKLTKVRLYARARNTANDIQLLVQVRLVRHSQRKRGATDRLNLRSMAPVLDPTSHDGMTR
jgi:hypothetical protein